MKIGNPTDAPGVMAEIEREMIGARNIRLMLDKLAPGDHAALVQCSDVIVSLHRAEGFGLVLAEAMVLGKTVLATGWSGNMSFMSTENSVLVNYRMVPIADPQNVYSSTLGSWAEPSVDKTASWLRALAKNGDLRRRIGGCDTDNIHALFEGALLRGGKGFALRLFRASVQ